MTENDQSKLKAGILVRQREVSILNAEITARINKLGREDETNKRRG